MTITEIRSYPRKSARLADVTLEDADEFSGRLPFIQFWAEPCPRCQRDHAVQFVRRAGDDPAGFDYVGFCPPTGRLLIGKIGTGDISAVPTPDGRG